MNILFIIIISGYVKVVQCERRQYIIPHTYNEKKSKEDYKDRMILVTSINLIYGIVGDLLYFKTAIETIIGSFICAKAHDISLNYNLSLKRIYMPLILPLGFDAV